MALILIGLDDTDLVTTRGTGYLARQLANDLLLGSPGGMTVVGVTRHQLLVDPRIPYTSHNSSAAIHLAVQDEQAAEPRFLAELFEHVRVMMLAEFVPGSDPGLCVVSEDTARALLAFGQRAKREVVTQAEARRLAQEQGALLAGLGGSEDGVIGALSAVGLAAGGDDGRYLLLGQLRELSGLQSIEAVRAAGALQVRDEQEQPVTSGLVRAERIRPARRAGQPVLYVRWDGEYWEPLKLG